MNEREAIQYIEQLTGVSHPDLVQGIGDDCAVVRKNDHQVLLLTMDTLVESVHFDCSWHSPELLGRKTVSVNVSDICAMGGTPSFLLFSAGLPRNFDEAWFALFMQGMTRAARDYNCLLIGGDTVCSPSGWNFSITAIGEAQEGQVLYRNGAQPGDSIWVSGPLGLAAAGLELFIAGKKQTHQDLDSLYQAHLDPVARVDLGPKLARTGLVTAMMDLSDGLATDLAHLITRSEVGARVIKGRLPHHPALEKASKITGKSVAEFILYGGEDFELLFTAPDSATSHLMALGSACGKELFRIGRIEQGQDVLLVDKDAAGKEIVKKISYKGYDHFVKN